MERVGDEGAEIEELRKLAEEVDGGRDSGAGGGLLPRLHLQVWLEARWVGAVTPGMLRGGPN